MIACVIKKLRFASKQKADSAKSKTQFATVLFALTLFSFLRPIEAAAWKPVGPDLATAFAFSVDPFDTERILIGTFFNGIYLSENGGSSWSAIAPEFSSAFVQDIEADQKTKGTFYAATFERGVFKTSDNGKTWGRKSDGLASLNIRGISISPISPNLLLSCSFAGPYFSVDGGDYWLPSENENLPCISAIHSEAFASVVYLGTDGQGVYRSIDGGVNWEAWNQGIENNVVFDLILDPTVSEVVWAATDKGVFRRGAGDDSWTNLKFNLPDANIDHIVFHPDGRVLASCGVGVFSYNKADPETWYLWNEKPARFVIPFPKTDGKFLLAGFEDTLDVTFDDGQTVTSSVEGVQNNFPDALATLVYQGDNIVLAGLDSGVWRSNETDSPNTRIWTQADSIKEHLIFELTPHPTREGQVYAGTERAGVWFSEDAGATWVQRSEGIYPRTIHDLAQSALGDETFYCATEVGIFISKDHGRNWKMGTNVAVPSLITAVEADPVKEGFAYYGTATGALFFTSNDRDFQPGPSVPSGIKTIRAAAFQGVYVVTFDGSVYSSRNDSLQLDPRAEGLDFPVLDVAVNQQQTEIVYAGTAGGGVYKTVSEASLWAPSNAGIENQYIFSVALDPQTPSRVFAGSRGAVYFSADSGANWLMYDTGLPADGNIGRILVDPVDSDLLYCSVEGMGIYRSIDAGVTWTDLELPSEEATGNLPIALSTSDHDELFVGSKALGVQRWDPVDNWNRSASGITDLVRGIAIGRDNPDLMYAATLNSGMFRSTDAGLNWVRDGLEEYRLLHVEMNPKSDDEIMAGTTIGPAVSRDSGASWQFMGQKVAYSQALATIGDSGETIIVGGSGGLLFYSEDRGYSWMQSPPSLPSNEITVLKPAGNEALFAGVDAAGLYRTSHPSEAWTLISDNRFAEDKIVSIAVDPIYKQVFVASLLNGLFLTNFDGSSWSPIALPYADYANKPITAIARDPLAPNRLFVSRANLSNQEPTLHISNDRGSSWTSAGTAQGLPGGTVHWVAASPHVTDFVLCGTDDGIYRSVDAGQSWDITSLRGAVVDRITYDPVERNTVYATALGIAMFISHDRGLSWSPITWDPALLVSQLQTGDEAGELIATTYEHGLYLSDNYGQSWRGGTVPEETRVTVSFVAYDPVSPSKVYFATSQHGILRSFDNGQTLSYANNGLGPHLTLLTIAVDPNDPLTLYAGTISDGVYVSSDRGNSWTPMREGMPHELTISLAINPSRTRTIYAGVEGGGVYKIERESAYLDPLADHDGDTIPTIWEQILNLNPLEKDERTWRPFSLPSLNSTEYGTTFTWYTGTEAPQQPAILRIESSTDLINWTLVAEQDIKSEPIEPIDGTTLKRNTISLKDIDDQPTKKFLRLTVSRD